MPNYRHNYLESITPGAAPLGDFIDPVLDVGVAQGFVGIQRGDFQAFIVADAKRYVVDGSGAV